MPRNGRIADSALRYTQRVNAASVLAPNSLRKKASSRMTTTQSASA